MGYSGGDIRRRGAIGPRLENGTEVVRYADGHWVHVGSANHYVDRLHSVVEHGQQVLYAVGNFWRFNTRPTAGIARWDGASWTTYPNQVFRAGDQSIVIDLGLGPRLYAMGGEQLPGGGFRGGLFRWEENRWTYIGTPDPICGTCSPPYVTCLGEFDDGRGPVLYIGGIFRSFIGVEARNLVRSDGTRFEKVGAGIVGEPSWLGAIRTSRGWSLDVGGDVLTQAGGGLLEQSAAILVGCRGGNCYPDCDVNRVLDAIDFVCFAGKFAERDPYANCTFDDGTIDMIDFICFMVRFTAGCNWP